MHILNFYQRRPFSVFINPFGWSDTGVLSICNLSARVTIVISNVKTGCLLNLKSNQVFKYTDPISADNLMAIKFNQ